MWTPQRIAMALVALLAPAALSPSARPCSVINNIRGGFIDGATVGPRPLLFGVHAPSLIRTDDMAVLVEFVPVPELGTVMIQGQVGQAWRPAEPLAAGEYTVHNALILTSSNSTPRLFVDPELVEAPPEVPPVELRLVLGEPEEAGCSLDGGDSCSDIDPTKLEVVIAADRERDQILFTAVNPLTGERRSGVLGNPLPGPFRVTLFEITHGGILPGSLKKDRLCYRATPLSEAGTLGVELELGCIRPTDNDPRTDDLRGCAAGPLGLQHLGLWLFALVLGRARLANSSGRARLLTS